MGFLDKNIREIVACLETNLSLMHGASTYRIMIPTIPTFGIGAHQTMMVTVIVMAV